MSAATHRKRTGGDRLAQARRLKAVRDWTDVTRADVARAVGVDASTVSVWEGGRLPGDDRLELAAKFLGVSPAWIRYGLASTAPPAVDLTADDITDPRLGYRYTDDELDQDDADAARTRGKRGPRRKAK